MPPRLRRLGAPLALALMSACVGAPPPADGLAPATVAVRDVVPRSAAGQAFVAAAARVEPAAEAVCRERAAAGTPCDFEFVLVTDPRFPPNAYQTLDPRGRPIVGFSTSLVAQTRNADEIAFILSHEAAHHIEGHIATSRAEAEAGGALGAAVATLAGLDRAAAGRVAQATALLSVRRYSKRFELEADALGTAITARAGYDPLRGSAFFRRIPDPGDRFLGTHPPNAERVAVVRRAAAALR